MLIFLRQSILHDEGSKQRHLSPKVVKTYKQLCSKVPVVNLRSSAPESPRLLSQMLKASGKDQPYQSHRKLDFQAEKSHKRKEWLKPPAKKQAAEVEDKQRSPVKKDISGPKVSSLI